MPLQPLNNWTMVYTIDPLEHFGPGSGGDPARVLGGEVPMWTEHVVPAVLDYTLWPRAAAAGERLWSRREDTQDLAGQPAPSALLPAGAGWPYLYATSRPSRVLKAPPAWPSPGRAHTCMHSFARERPQCPLSWARLPHADAAARLERFSRQLAARGLCVSPLDWRGDNFRCAPAQPCEQRAPSLLACVLRFPTCVPGMQSA